MNDKPTSKPDWFQLHQPTDFVTSEERVSDQPAGTIPPSRASTASAYFALGFIAGAIFTLGAFAL